MRRMIGLALLTPMFVWGCGRSDVSDSAATTHSFDATAQAAAKNGDAPALADAAQPALSAQSQLTADVATLMQSAGRLELKGDYDQAAATWQLVRQRLSEEHGATSWQVKNVDLMLQAVQQRSQFSLEDRVVALEIADLESNADIDRQAGRLPAAISAIDQAVQRAEKLWGPTSHVTLNLRAKLASFHSLEGDDEVAARELDGIVAGRIQVFGKQHPDTLRSMQDLSTVSLKLHDYDAAVRWGTTSIEVATALYGEESLEVALQRNNLGVALYTAHDFDRAIRHLTQALELRSHLAGLKSMEVGHSLHNLGLAKLGAGRVNEAELDFATAIEIFAQDASQFGALAESQIQLGTVFMVRSEFEAAEGAFRSARATLEDQREMASLEFADACFKLGVALGKQGKYPSAEIQLREALEIQRRVLPVDHPGRQQTEEIYALVQAKIGAIRTGQRPGTLQR